MPLFHFFSHLFLWCAAIIAVGLAAPVALFAQSGTQSFSAKALNETLVDVSKNISPTVVSITVSMRKTDDKRLQYFEEYLRQYGENFNADKYRSKSIGSGVFITDNGYIVTNNHVVEDTNEDSIMVTTSDGSIYLADLIGRDPSTDVAVIRIYGKAFTSAIPANSDNVNVGQMVLAVGSPLGLRSTVTFGIVSALSRGEFKEENNDDEIQNFIQTDAPINPGNSGGGLFDLDGRLVGINTSIYTSTGYYLGYGFAIPFNLVKSVAGDLMEDGKIDRVYLGIDASSVDDKKAVDLRLPKNKGIVVDDIDTTSPAFKAGILKKDVIVEVDGKGVNAINELQDILTRRRPGDTVEFNTWRDQQYIKRTVVLSKRESLLNELVHSRRASLCVHGDVSDSSNVKGVALTRVLRYGAAEKAGLQEDDIITAINGNAMATVEDLSAKLNEFKPGDSVQVQYQRKGEIKSAEVVLHSAR